MRQRYTIPVLAALAAPHAASAQLSTPFDSATLASVRWRNIGPANMSGRVTDIEAVPGNPRIFYVATAAGGIWKTINAGTTFHPLFDREKVVSMGDMAIAPSNPDVLYAGTGEEDSRNSISPGGGVYKSTDAGKTWTLVGLEDTQQIGRIVVHPTNPDIAYVAALGHTWGPNKERGLYKTADGGKTWRLVKFVSDRAGFVDVAMDPSNPDVLYAASWERVRGPYLLKSGGPGSALWKTTDGGATWTEIRGGGLPTTTKGRIGLAIAPSNPQVIYAMVEADSLPNPKKGPLAQLKPGEETYGLGSPSYARSKTQSGIYRSTDGGRTWERTWRYTGDQRPFYYSQIRVDPKNPDRIYWASSVFRFSDDGGKTERIGALGVHVDWHAMWIDPNDPDHWIAGNDGGVAITYDKGGTLIHPNTMAIGQFYQVSYDMQPLYRVCGGLQDNGSWCGPSRSRNRGGITNADWINVGGGDGFFTANDPTDPNIVYSESQGGRINRVDLASGTITPIRRSPRGFTAFEDSLIVARGDTAQPETPEIGRRLQEIRARARADSALALRFNWNTPFFLSPHSPSTVYAGGNRVLKSVNRGDVFVPISPDLSTKDSAKIKTSLRTTGGITPDVTGAEAHGTVTALAESPLRPGILWAGTDDGNLWLTRNDGATWENLTGRFPGLPARTWTSRIEASAFDSARVYVAFDNHRVNDFAPYLYMSEDFGRTFRSIAGGLPKEGPAFVHVVREDPVNRNLLYVGTDVAAYVSPDRGRTWQRFPGLPTVPVHDLKVHPRERELIAGTHGRSIYVGDVAPLQELADSILRKELHVFAVRPAYQYTQVSGMNENGHMVFKANNPPYGAALAYRVGGTARPQAVAAGDGAAAPSGAGSARNVPSVPSVQNAQDPRDTTSAPNDGAAAAAAATDTAKGPKARIVITDVKGDTIRVLTGPAGPGLHRVYWDLRYAAKPLGPAALRDSVARARIEKQRQDSIKAATGKDLVAEAERAMRPEAMERNPRPAELPLGAGSDARQLMRRGGRNGLHVEPGEYVAHLTVNGRTTRQVIKVVRLGDVRDESGLFGER